MSTKRTVSASRRRFQWLVLLLMLPVAASVPNVTLCTSASFRSSSGYIYSENYPDSITNQAFTCWCSVSGEADVWIMFHAGHIQSSAEACKEDLRLYDCQGRIIVDSCQDQDLFVNDAILSPSGIAKMQLTLKKYPDLNGQSSGRFSLFITGSRSVSVTCTANRRAAVQSLCENPSAEFGMEVTIISTTLVITGSFVMLLALCLILMRRKKPRKKPVPPLFYLEKLSRRQRDSKINDYGSLPRNRSEEQDIGGQTGPTSDPVGGDVPGGRSSPNGGYEDIRPFVRNQLPQAQPTGSTMSGELSEGPSRANQVEHDGNNGSGHSDESNAEQNANEYGECLHAEPRAESRDEVLSHSNLNASPVDDPCYDSDHN